MRAHSSTEKQGKSNHRSRWLAAIGGAILALKSPDLYAQLRVAVIDVQRVLTESDEGRHARDQIVVQFQKKQADINGRTEALRLLKEDITTKTKNKTLPDRDLAKLNEDYKSKVVELEQNYMAYQEELSKQEADHTKKILDNLKVVVQQFGQDNNYNAVLDQSMVIWAADGLDVTEQVVQRYNLRFPPHEELPPPPAADGGVSNTPSSTPASAVPATTPTTPASTRPTTPATTPTRSTANPHPRGEGTPPQAPKH